MFKKKIFTNSANFINQRIIYPNILKYSTKYIRSLSKDSPLGSIYEK